MSLPFFLRFYFRTFKKKKAVNCLPLIYFYPSHLQSEKKWAHWIPPSEWLTTEDEQKLILCYYLALRKVYRITSYWPFQVNIFKNSVVVGSLDKPQREPFRKHPNACTWSLSVSLKQFFFFKICLTFQTNAMELRFHFSHHMYYKLGVQFEHLSNGTRADFNQYHSLPKLAEMLLQC